MSLTKHKGCHSELVSGSVRTAVKYQAITGSTNQTIQIPGQPGITTKRVYL